jgi:hypothetical protein
LDTRYFAPRPVLVRVRSRSELARSRETVRNWISRFTDNALVAELIGAHSLF